MGSLSSRAGLHTWAARLALVGAVAFTVYFAYGLIRTRSGPLDRTAAQKLGYFARSLIAPGFLVGIFVVPPTMIFQVWKRSDRPRNRLRSGQCPNCAYPLLTGTTVCPECGQTTSAPHPTEWNTAWRALNQICLLTLIGAILGAAPAELLILLDERAFKAEAAAAPKPYWRVRHGPFYGELSCDQNGVLWVVDD